MVLFGPEHEVFERIKELSRSQEQIYLKTLNSFLL
jgi:hypothetical protein